LRGMAPRTGETVETDPAKFIAIRCEGKSRRAPDSFQKGSGREAFRCVVALVVIPRANHVFNALTSAEW